MFDYIPEGAVLDFRGLINISDVDYAYGYIDGLTIISSTKDAVIDGNITFNYNYSISDINVTGNLRIHKSTDVRNCNVKTLKIIDNNLMDVAIVNVTVSGSTIITTYGTGGNVSICDSSLFGGLRGDDDDSTDVVPPLTVKNCFIGDGLFGNGVIGGHMIIEDNVINGHIYIRGGDIIIRNNIITASGSKYALDFNTQGNITIVNNTIYNYGYEYAIWVPNNVNVTDNRLFSNNFGNNALKTTKNPKMDTIIIENNTPDQIHIVLTNTKRILYDENVTISAGVSAVGNVTIDVNGKKYGIELVDGIASLTINEYLSGTNMIRVYYSDVANDIYGYNDATFYVEKIDKCPVDLIYSDVIEGKISSIEVMLPDDAKGIITFRIFNSTHSVKVAQSANGRENIIMLPDLAEGNYMMNVTFTSDKYVTNSSSGNISFIHNPVYKLTANNIVMDYKDGSKFKVLLTRDGKAVVGEVVKITFNGKTSNVKTDKDGYATLSLDGAPKTYTIKTVYKGITKSSKLTIKSVLKAKNISKKKSKTVKFSATLKTSKGKAIGGKKITFKLKGKSYSVKTNKKGVATISLKNLKTGKYKITSIYGACTVKNTITIKK